MATPVAGEYKQLFQKRTAYKGWVTRARACPFKTVRK